jgi:hypothetical protein
VAVSYTGQTLVTVGLENQLVLRDREGAVRTELTLSASPVAVAVEALGESAVAVLANKEIVRVELPGEPRDGTVGSDEE